MRRDYLKVSASVKPIEGIEFSQHHLGPGHWHARVVCHDGANISIIQCDGTGEFCNRFKALGDTSNRGCFYGNTTGEQVFEILDSTASDAEGYLTDLEVVRRIMAHGGINYQKPVP